MIPHAVIAQPGTRHVFLRDMIVQASIGIYPHERGALQRVRINVDLAVAEDPAGLPDRLEGVVDYESVATRVRGLATTSHTNLVETLAERIAQACFVDGRVHFARVRVEKLDVFDDIGAVGVEIARSRTTDYPPIAKAAEL